MLTAQASSQVISHDTRRFRFALPSPQHILGLPVGEWSWGLGQRTGSFALELGRVGKSSRTKDSHTGPSMSVRMRGDIHGVPDSVSGGSRAVTAGSWDMGSPVGVGRGPGAEARLAS